MLSLLLKTIQNITLGIRKGLDFMIAFALFPLRVLGGQANMAPKFRPEITGDDLLAGLQKKREQAVSASVIKDGVAIIYKYAKATPRQRSTIDLSALPYAVRQTLLTMSNAELDVLSTAGQHEVRKFANGQEHGIFGLPKVDLNTEPVAQPKAEPKTPGWVRPPALRAVQVRLLREMKKDGGAYEFKMPAPRP